MGQFSSLLGRFAALVSALTVACALPTLAAAAPAATIATEHVEARFFVRQARALPGDRAEIAIAHTLSPGWHTYWSNPGDTGAPPEFAFSLPQGGQQGDVRFPPPEALPYPPLLNYGYDAPFTLLTDIAVPADWPAGEPFPVSVDATWLVCADICIPETGRADFSIPTGAQSIADPAVAFTFLQAERALPGDSAVEASYSREGDALYLSLPIAGIEPDGAHFFPHTPGVVVASAPQEAIEAVDGDGMTMVLSAGGASLDGTLSGVLTTADGAFAVTALGDPDPLPPAGGPSSATAPQADLTALADRGASLSAALPDASNFPLAQIVLFAFLGGLILNLMPCVFPVLALKTLALVRHADAPLGERAGNGLAYTAGIVTTFLVLAAVLVAVRSAGVAVGWGFQLQSPVFVMVLSLLFLAAALNLSGVFEFGVALTRLGGRAEGPDDVARSFGTGVLATLVATPCTAPFMAVAVGAALATSPMVTVVVFTALGLGLAAPFLLASLVPGVGRVLPRPGAWMEKLKQGLAFPLYATVAWLLWVLSQLVDAQTLLLALFACVAIAFAAWLWGLAQRTSGRAPVTAGLGVAALVLSAALAFPTVEGARASKSAGVGGPAGIGERAPTDDAYSARRVAALRAEGRSVFINVTAAWCITCKVNESLVFAGDGFAALLDTHDVAFLTADWTRRDAEVTRFLEEFGRVGVPLYVFIPADGAPVVLPQILTTAALEAAFSA